MCGVIVAPVWGGDINALKAPLSPFFKNKKQPAQDPERLHKLALQLLTERKHQQALNAALASVRADRQWNDRAAQKLLLASFKALGADNPSVRGARARLTNILFV